MYTSLIDPHFVYCASIYDACKLEQKRELQTSQNKALRAVLQVDKYYDTTLLHEETNIEWLGVMRARLTCIDMYKFLHDQGPLGVTKDVCTYVPARSLRSENSTTIVRPKLRTKFAENDLVIRGSKYWDLLHEDTRSSASLAIFKSRTKQDDCFYLPAFTNYKNVYYLGTPL